MDGGVLRSFQILMSTIRNEIVEYVMVVKDQGSKNEANVKRNCILNKWQRIQSMNDELMCNPNYDVNPILALEKDMMPILLENMEENLNRGPVQPGKSVFSSAKLPKLNVPIFSGEYVKFKSFKELFHRMIGSKEELDACEKLAYLQGQLKGEPLNLISTLPIEGSSYETA